MEWVISLGFDRQVGIMFLNSKKKVLRCQCFDLRLEFFFIRSSTVRRTPLPVALLRNLPASSFSCHIYSKTLSRLRPKTGYLNIYVLKMFRSYSEPLHISF